MTSQKYESISKTNNDETIYSSSISKGLFNPISQMISSKITSIKERIITGDIISNFTEEEEPITPEMRLFSLSLSNMYSNFLLDLAPTQRQKSKIVIRKIKLGSFPTNNKKSKSNINSIAAIQVKSPNSIINQTKLKHISETKPEQYNINIFRETKRHFRSISKEIDKRTKKEFNMAKKNFQFMQFRNPFLPCHYMNVNATDKKNISNYINLPYLNYISGQRNNQKPLIGLLRLSKDSKGTNLSYIESNRGNSSRRELENSEDHGRISSAFHSKSLKRNASALLREKKKI